MFVSLWEMLKRLVTSHAIQGQENRQFRRTNYLTSDSVTIVQKIDQNIIHVFLCLYGISLSDQSLLMPHLARKIDSFIELTTSLGILWLLLKNRLEQIHVCACMVCICVSFNQSFLLIFLSQPEFAAFFLIWLEEKSIFSQEVLKCYSL